MNSDEDDVLQFHLAYYKTILLFVTQTADVRPEACAENACNLFITIEF